MYKQHRFPFGMAVLLFYNNYSLYGTRTAKTSGPVAVLFHQITLKTNSNEKDSSICSNSNGTASCIVQLGRM